MYRHINTAMILTFFSFLSNKHDRIRHAIILCNRRWCILCSCTSAWTILVPWELSIVKVLAHYNFDSR